MACKNWNSCAFYATCTEGIGGGTSTLEVYAQEGRLELLQLIWQKRLCQLRTNRVESVAKAAGIGGHVPLLRWIKQERPFFTPHVDNIMFLAAAKNGHEGAVRMCHDEWNMLAVDMAMQKAARGGHEHLVRQCYAWGGRRLEWVMAAAAKGGHERIMRIIRDEWDATVNVGSSLAAAAEAGNEHLAQLCYEQWGARNVDQAMVRGAKSGHERIMRMCHDEWGATYLNDAMFWAARYGHEHIVRLCIEEWRATDVVGAMVEAACRGHEGIVRLCYEKWGASAAGVAAVLKLQGLDRHDHIVAMCETWQREIYSQ